VAITDTSPEASAVQLALYRKLDPSARVQIAVELSEAVRETAVAGIRRRHPGYSDEEVWHDLRVILYGPARDER
jgi:hypothetical protein